MELNNINEKNFGEGELIKTEQEKYEQYKKMQRGLVDCFLSCFKNFFETLGIKTKYLVSFVNFSGALYNIVHKIEIAKLEDLSSLSLFFDEIKAFCKKISDLKLDILKPNIDIYSKIDIKSYEESVNKIKSYCNLILKDFIYDKREEANYCHRMGVVHDDDSPKNIYIVEKFNKMLEFVLSNKFRHKFSPKLDEYLKDIGLNSGCFFYFFEALSGFINEFYKPKEQNSIVNFLDILLDIVREMQSNIKTYNLLYIYNGLKENNNKEISSVFREKEFYKRYINIILLKSVLKSVEESINKFSNNNKDILRQLKRMLAVVLMTKDIRQYLEKFFRNPEISKNILKQVIYFLIDDKQLVDKNKSINSLFDINFIRYYCSSYNSNSYNNKPKVHDSGLVKNKTCKQNNIK